MARSIAEIRAEIIAAKEAEPALSTLNVVSVLSKSRLWIFVISAIIWTLENLISITISNQNNSIKNQKRYSFSDYSTLAKGFQFGFLLPVGETEYNNEGVDSDLVEASKIVKYANSIKVWGGIKIKVAGVFDTELVPISPVHFEAFKAYMERVKAAGDYIEYVNEEADMLFLNLKIFRDPLVLDFEGKRTDGTNDTPIKEAIQNFIKQMDFDKKFIPGLLVSELNKVEGVKLAHLNVAQSKYALFPWVDIPESGVSPNSGYVKIYNPEDLIINYEIWED